MIKSRIPVSCRVTLRAVGRHLCRFVIGISGAVVIGQVAIDTQARSALEHTADVALLTGCLNVGSR